MHTKCCGDPAFRYCLLSIQIKRRTVILLWLGILLGFTRHTVADHEQIEFIAHNDPIALL
jgi:hypothetical protein